MLRSVPGTQRRPTDLASWISQTAEALVTVVSVSTPSEPMIMPSEVATRPRSRQRLASG
jgi:hypothetical protein